MSKRSALKQAIGGVCVGLVLPLTILMACTASDEDGEVSEAVPADTTESRKLHYFTWSDYVDREILEAFERENHVKLVVDTFSSNEELLAKVQNGGAGYDVAVPSDFMVTLLVKQGLLAKIDHGNVPNLADIDPALMNLSFDPKQDYSVPYLWGTVGIGYDSNVISSPPDSWEVLWDPAYKGRISMLNDQREVLGVALRALGYSLNETTPTAINQAKVKLLTQKPLVKVYTSENYDHLLASGEVVLAHGWGGAIARAIHERPSLRYVVPKEGGTIWTDCLVILKSSTKVDLATRFINYLIGTDVSIRTTNRLQFASANRKVKEKLSLQLRNNPAVYPPEDSKRRLEWMVDVGEAVHLYDRAWTELKMK